MSETFHLDSTEIRELNTWIQEHVKTKHPKNYFENPTSGMDLLMNGIGVTLEYRSGGGIGTKVIGICSICKEEKDVSNYHHW
jgi:hypothetical protein